jgi:FAD:protein FMN transferase
MTDEVRVEQQDDAWRGTFHAMAGPCEVLLDIDDGLLAHHLVERVHQETRRIEKKFSRYLDDSIVQKINNSAGQSIEVDEETSRILQFADSCYHASNNRFDITSGILRKLWTFNANSSVPSRKQVKSLLPLIGWNKVTWEPPHITLPSGMQIDLGGICKEYAVDQSISVAQAETQAPILVNFGGDLHASHPRRGNLSWRVGVERPGIENQAERMVDLESGALATSGDARKYVMHQGKRLSHILNPRTGWPVTGAPRSVTVAAESCLQAGVLATTAMIHGRHAEQFLEAESERWWVSR